MALSVCAAATPAFGDGGANGNAITGVVVDETGRRVAGASVTAYLPDFEGTQVGEKVRKREIASTRADRKGAYVLTVEPGSVPELASRSGKLLEIEVNSAAGNGVKYLTRRVVGGTLAEVRQGSTRGRAVADEHASTQIEVGTSRAPSGQARSNVSYCDWVKDSTEIRPVNLFQMHSVDKTQYKWSYGQTAATHITYGYQLAPGGSWETDGLLGVTNSRDAAVGINPTLGRFHEWIQSNFRFGLYTLRPDDPTSNSCSNWNAQPGGRMVSPEAWTGGISVGYSAPQMECNSSVPLGQRSPQIAGSYFTKNKNWTEITSAGLSILGLSLQSTTEYGAAANLHWTWTSAGNVCGDYYDPVYDNIVYVG